MVPLRLVEVADVHLEHRLRLEKELARGQPENRVFLDTVGETVELGDERPAWRQDQGKLPELEAPLLLGLRFPLQAFEVNRVNPGIALGIRYGQQRDHDPRCGAPISQVDETL
ncbi:MAG: hypothetical protein MK554_08940, partial [Planctomycetes bacterium]|nr:hypothetical protein [Planctomycetota bacterium]